MTPSEFIQRWRGHELVERQAAQAHFTDLCRMLDVPVPTDDAVTHNAYCFERGTTKTTGGEGWADFWKLVIRSGSVCGRVGTESGPAEIGRAGAIAAVPQRARRPAASDQSLASS